jgi:23S rRNA (uracil1939-C5)-methyltransferase
VPRPHRKPLPAAAPRSVEVRVEAPTLDGDFVARASDGSTLRVFGAIPGERVVAVQEGRGPARVERIIDASPHRVRAPCRHFGACGGCAWQHIAYPEQLRLKQRLVSDLLKLDARPTLGIPGEPWGFRDKVHYTVGPGPTLGHYRRGTQELLPIEECPVHAPEGDRLARAAGAALARRRVPGTDERSTRAGGRGVARHVLARVGEGTGQTQLTIVSREPRFKQLDDVKKDLLALERPPTGLHLNVHEKPGPFILGPESRKLHGRERLLEKVAGVEFLISPQAFFQTSVRSAERLVEAALACVPEGAERVLDLFSGVGLFSLPLAKRGAQVLAVEENPHAVEDGALSRRKNDIPDAACRFVRERAEVAVRRLVDEGRTFSTILVDPPRDGCPPGLLEQALTKLGAARLVYVSCNPEALAADLERAARLGWAVAHVQPVDMFPHTPHVESVALLVPKGRDGRSGAIERLSIGGRDGGAGRRQG